MKNETDLMQKIKDSKNNDDIMSLIKDRFGKDQEGKERIHNAMVYEQIYNNMDFEKRLRWLLQKLTNKTGILSLPRLEAYIAKIRSIDVGLQDGLNYWKITDYDSLHAKIATPNDFKGVVDLLSSEEPIWGQIDVTQLKGNVKDKLDLGKYSDAIDLVAHQFGRENLDDTLCNIDFDCSEDAIEYLAKDLYDQVGSWKHAVNVSEARDTLNKIDKINQSKVPYWNWGRRNPKPIDQVVLFDAINILAYE